MEPNADVFMVSWAGPKNIKVDNDAQENDEQLSVMGVLISKLIIMFSA